MADTAAHLPNLTHDETAGQGAHSAINALPYVSFNQLRSFHAVALTGSVTSAAALLYISQPTVTTQLRQIESHYGIELVQRTPHGVVLSTLGKELFSLTKKIFDIEEQIVDLLGQSATTVCGELRIGGVAPSYVMRVLTEFTRAHPTLTLSLHLDNSAHIVQEVVEQRLDVGIVGQTTLDTRLLAVPYSKQRVILFCRDDHPWADRDGVQLNELADEPLVMREQGSTSRLVLQQALEKHGISPRIALEINREGIRDAVIAGLGIGVTTEVEYIDEPRTHKLPLTDEDIVTEAFAICARSRQHAPAIRAFMNTAEQIFDCNESTDPRTSTAEADSRRINTAIE